MIDLTHKSKLLQVELGKTSKQLKEATAIAEEEAAKCHAAKEVIKSLTGQVQFPSLELATLIVLYFACESCLCF